MGAVLSIKPILYLDAVGKIDALARVRTKRKALRRLVKLAVDQAGGGTDVHLGVMHSNTLQEAEDVRDQIHAQVDCVETEVLDLSPVIGTHVGPGTVGVAVYNHKT
jgi:DegV family protein with EDD domain